MRAVMAFPEASRPLVPLTQARRARSSIPVRLFSDSAKPMDYVVLRLGVATLSPSTNQVDLLAEVKELLFRLTVEQRRLRLDHARFQEAVAMLREQARDTGRQNPTRRDQQRNPAASFAGDTRQHDSGFSVAPFAKDITTSRWPTVPLLP